jgi:hypothetical protein
MLGNDYVSTHPRMTRIADRQDPARRPEPPRADGYPLPLAGLRDIEYRARTSGTYLVRMDIVENRIAVYDMQRFSQGVDQHMRIVFAIPLIENGCRRPGDCFSLSDFFNEDDGVSDTVTVANTQAGGGFCYSTLVLILRDFKTSDRWCFATQVNSTMNCSAIRYFDFLVLRLRQKLVAFASNDGNGKAETGKDV